MARRTPRRVDWVVTTGDDPARARLASPSKQPSGLAELTAALLVNPSRQTADRILHEAVEFARDGIGLERAAIYLVGPDDESMSGTWGTDAHGQTTDEHTLVFAVDEFMRKFFQRSSQGYAWSVYEDCPMLTHEKERTHVLGRGWLACTAIQGSSRPIGILYNDTALTKAPVDEAKQALAAVLCSLLGRTLDACRYCLFDSSTKETTLRHPLVHRASEVLSADPSLSFEEVARRLHMTRGHLTRAFKRHASSSIVEYRNELRMAQFLSQVNSKGLRAAALDAGFGSYAQFHRIFRARFGKAPRDYLLGCQE